MIKVCKLMKEHLLMYYCLRLNA